MVNRRDIVACILLSIVTCGIYGLYWFVCLNDELNIASGQEDQSGVVVLLLSIVTCGIYYYFWAYKAGEKIDTIKMRYNRLAGNNAALFLVLAIFQLSIVINILIQNELNDMASV